MQVGGSPTKSNKSRNVAIGTLIAGAAAGVGNEIKKARTAKLKKKYNEASIAASESGVGKGQALTDKEKYARKLQKRGVEMGTMKTGGTVVGLNKKITAVKSPGGKAPGGINKKVARPKK